MKEAEGSNPSPVLLLGAVRGSVREAPRIVSALERFRPTLLALGLSPEEVHALEEHFSDPYIEPWVPLASVEMGYARGIARFGPARVPSPSFLQAIRWARGRSIEVLGAEPGDDAYGSLFVDHVGYLDLLRRTLAERSLGKAPPEVEDEEAFALAWESRSQPGRGSRRLGEARARHMSEKLRELCTSARPTSAGASLKNRVALVVDVERYPVLLRALRDAVGSDLRERSGPASRSGPGPSTGDEGGEIPPRRPFEGEGGP